MTRLQPQQALTFAYDYNPGMGYRVVASLQQDVVRAILGRRIQGNRIVSDPADWNAYIINYRPGGNAPGEYALVFTRGGSLQQNQTYRFGSDASFFAARANLLEASISTGGGGGGGGTTTTQQGTTTTQQGTTTTTEGGTPTPEEGTPTPTPEEGGGGGENGGS